MDSAAHFGKGSVVVHDVSKLRLYEHPVNTDDRPLFEYRFLRELAGEYDPVRVRLFELVQKAPYYRWLRVRIPWAVDGVARSS